MTAGALEALLGPNRVREGEGGRVIAFPQHADQAAALLAKCSTDRVGVALTGHDTVTLDARAQVVISARDLRGILEYEPADLTVQVAAGTPRSELAITLQRQRQRWPVDAPAGPRATIGGAIAKGEAGPARYVDGTPRDHVLGLELVTGDGRVLKFGGRVVKNVAGYDMTRLVTGSRGTLGLITSAHLRLRALPESEVTAVWFAAHPKTLLERAVHVQSAWPAALELLSPQVSHAVTGEVRWALLVRARGNAEFTAGAVRRFAALEPDRMTEPSAAADGTWEALDRSERDAKLMIRISGLPSTLDTLLDVALEITNPDAGRWRIAAHASNGIVRVWRSDAIDEDRANRLARSIESARISLVEYRAVIDVAQGSAMMPDSFEPRAAGDVERRLIDGVRRVFDPVGILSTSMRKTGS